MKDRKNPQLWQSYLWWREMMELRKKHNLRISASERGASNLDAHFEQTMIEALALNAHVDPKNKAERQFSIKQTMINYGEAIGPIWDWCLSIKGLGDGLTAQLLAQIDDIENFATVASLWRFCGFGIFLYWVDESGKPQAPHTGWKWVGSKLVDKKKQFTIVDTSFGGCEKFPAPINEDYEFIDYPDNWHKQVKLVRPEFEWTLKKHRDVNIPGYHSPYNRILKSTCWNIYDQFVRQQTPGYVDIYYAEKERLRSLYPEPVKNGSGKKYTDGHIDYMAKRKMIKQFLKDLWLQWREFEGLPVTEAY